MVSEKLLDDLLHGRVTRVVASILNDLNTPHDLVQVLESKLVPVLWKVGTYWQESKIGIYQERICSGTILTALDRISEQMPWPATPKFLAVGGCLKPGEDSISSKLVALTIRSVGGQAIDLGSNVPSQAMADAANHFQPQVIWVSHTHFHDNETILQAHTEMKDLLKCDAKIFIGGGGLSPSVIRTLHWCHFVETLSQLQDTLKAIDTTDQSGKRYRIDRGGGLFALKTQLPETAQNFT
ncbi:cobalamin B12-binding domain-containing protein [Neorhodopirellula pilleata]|uniref:cobalamin B12-binding domain-containing protein n=1 Tax=Neorhodopirellula pilleata TaxID=2714738 RepID=UPI0018CF10CB|nr:B12-binding domain-containing protein [Neorhodopirellula pilleata]